MSTGMSPAWSEYVTNVLIESGYVSRAAIVGSDGRRWAASPTLELSSAEVKAIANGFVEPNSLRLDGISLCGKLYTCTRMDSVVMVGREGASGSGCIVYRCRNSLVIGVYEDGVHPGGCYNMICKVGDYLREHGLWKTLRAIRGNLSNTARARFSQPISRCAPSWSVDIYLELHVHLMSDRWLCYIVRKLI